MGFLTINAADSLVNKYPSRESQLRGPVLKYLTMEAKRLPFTKNPQDLYYAVFYPDYRHLSPSKELPKLVQKWNPGFKYIGDYTNRTNKISTTAWKLSSAEEKALRYVTDSIGVDRDTLYRLIAHESGWDPKALNKSSGARGLIQFMPSTAKGMGFKSGMSFGGLLFLAAGIFTLLKKRR